MSKRYPLAKWVLPEVVDPEERVCYVVSVPNERAHIGAFLGAIANLASAMHWQDDPAHTAKDVALVWRDIFDALIKRDCSMIGGDDVQFRQNGCKLEFSIDCVHWNTLYDPTDCIARLTGQPGPGGDIPEGDCQSYTLVLQANQRLLLPVGVQGGNRITVTGQSGGASDGTSAWNCPDGTPYILGACFGSAGHAGGDPSGTAFHMALLALVDGIYYDVSTDGSGFFVPDGTALTSLEFQVNDDDLSNNSGSYSFTVEVCNTPSATWSHDFDFTVNDGGWSPKGGLAHYVAATGWENNVGSQPETLYIIFNALHDSTLTKWEATFLSDGVFVSYGGAAIILAGVTLFRDNSLFVSPGGTLVFTGSTAVHVGDEFWLGLNGNASPETHFIATAMHFEGIGTDPFIP